MAIRLVPLAEIDTVWPQIAEAMETGCIKARSNIDVLTLYRGVRTGAGYLAVTDDMKGAVVVEVRDEQGTRVLDVIAFCGRDLDEWMPELLAWEWLNVWRVTRIMCEGRVGLAERLRVYIPNLKVVRQVFMWDR